MYSIGHSRRRPRTNSEILNADLLARRKCYSKNWPRRHGAGIGSTLLQLTLTVNERCATRHTSRRHGCYSPGWCDMEISTFFPLVQQFQVVVSVRTSTPTPACIMYLTSSCICLDLFPISKWCNHWQCMTWLNIYITYLCMDMGIVY